MYFKVYAQNCYAVQPVEMIPESNLDDVIYPLVQSAIENGLVEFTEDDNETDKKITAAYNKAKKHLENCELLSCGDYCIVKQDVVPTERPRMCGFDLHIFED